MRPEVKKRGGGLLPRGDRVKEHLQTGPGGSYILQRQTWLSLTYKKTLCCRRTSLKAWLLFHLSSVVTPHSPLTGSLCKLWCLTISYLDAEQFAEKKDQTGSFFISLAFSSSCMKMILCLFLPMCVVIHPCLDTYSQMSIQQHHYTGQKLNKGSVFSQSINQELIAINPTG